MTHETKLYKAVENIIEGHLEGDYTLEEFIADLMQGGCQSGLVGEMIYYTDTLKFYQDHKADINDMLKESLSSYGSSDPTDLFGDKWDSEDPLAFDTSNQNLLAWFAFEEVARVIAYDNDLDV